MSTPEIDSDQDQLPEGERQTQVAKYYLSTPTGFTLHLIRPTQAEIKAQGDGEYVLYRTDGSAIKRFTVAPNRNGNPSITALDPKTQIEGMKSLHLNRCLTHLAPVVKVWPEQIKLVRAIQRERDARRTLLWRVVGEHGLYGPMESEESEETEQEETA